MGVQTSNTGSFGMRQKREHSRLLVPTSLGIALLAFWHAFSLRWLCDDAFASFRYAHNWAKGLGLVFNAKERVEGITNPLWTLLLGVLSRLGMAMQEAALGVGVAAFVLSAVCIFLSVDARTHTTKWLAPVGALLVISDPDWATFATGGLETSAFTLSVLASYVLSWDVEDERRSGVAAGFVASISGMLRPDGALFVLPLALAFMGRRRRGLAPFLGVTVFLLGVFHLWRYEYYGSLLPNTYYAKSAFLSWWGQGLAYLGYFAIRHGVLIGLAVIGTLDVFIAAIFSKETSPHAQRHGLVHQLLVAWAMALTYVLSVVRVGGDFMYARLLVPVLPLVVIAFQKSLASRLESRPRTYSMLGCGVAIASFLWPCPVDTDIVAHRGIVDERAYYLSGFTQWTDRAAIQLRQCIEGYPVRAAIYGGELRLAYEAEIPYAIEAHAGLTDPVIAHKPIQSRQRVGHEKSADASYLVLTKKAHFATSPLY